VGGANAIMPDIHRQVVVDRAWMSEAQFVDAFTLSQVVPGPNLLVVSLIGWHVAGLPGAIGALLAVAGPSSLLTLLVARSLGHPQLNLWRQRLQGGLAPMTVGLVLATGVLLARGAAHSPVAVGLTVVSALVVLRTSVHPLLLMAAGAILGLAGLV
jgi:chromate transporter